MPLPLDLVLVRHGQSEGNLAKRLSEGGDDSAYSDEFRLRHTSEFRLSLKGREQARQAGEWIRREMHVGTNVFNRFYVSEYIRAIETAALLDLPGSTWFTESYLSERDWGSMESLPIGEREDKFGEALLARERQPYFWAPPNGESFMALCLRVDRILATLHRECGDKRVIIVCHGEVMWAFRLRLERMSQERFRELHISEKSEDRIHNCQILHYSRRDPVTSQPAQYLNWLRMIRPTDAEPILSDWSKIERPRYSNEDLLARAERVPVLVS